MFAMNTYVYIQFLYPPTPLRELTSQSPPLWHHDTWIQAPSDKSHVHTLSVNAVFPPSFWRLTMRFQQWDRGGWFIMCSYMISFLTHQYNTAYPVLYWLPVFIFYLDIIIIIILNNHFYKYVSKAATMLFTPAKPHCHTVGRGRNDEP